MQLQPSYFIHKTRAGAAGCLNFKAGTGTAQMHLCSLYFKLGFFTLLLRDVLHGLGLRQMPVTSWFLSLTLYLNVPHKTWSNSDSFDCDFLNYLKLLLR